MAVSFSVEIKGWEKAMMLFQKIRLSKPETRQFLKQLGIEMVRLGEELSPVDKVREHDWRRRPIEDSFSQQWEFEVDAERSYAPGSISRILEGGNVTAGSRIEAMELRVGNTDTRKEWIIEGTGPRPIPSNVQALVDGGQPMFFWWQDAFDGPGFYESWKIVGGVAAHGTPPHPVPDDILREINIPDILHLLSMKIVQ